LAGKSPIIQSYKCKYTVLANPIHLPFIHEMVTVTRYVCFNFRWKCRFSAPSHQTSFPQHHLTRRLPQQHLTRRLPQHHLTVFLSSIAKLFLSSIAKLSLCSVSEQQQCLISYASCACRVPAVITIGRSLAPKKKTAVRKKKQTHRHTQIHLHIYKPTHAYVRAHTCANYCVPGLPP
jgi:hypothetical protein